MAITIECRDALRQEIADLRQEKIKLKREISFFDNLWSDQKDTSIVQTFLKDFGCMSALPNGEEIIRAAEDVDAFTLSGVYFLIKDSAVVYVGQSTNVFTRLYQHMKTKEFDQFSWVPVEEKFLRSIEQLYIKLLKPPLNIVQPGSCVSSWKHGFYQLKAAA